MIGHFVSKTCVGETCACGQPASHKVGEEIAYDEPMTQEVLGLKLQDRHNFTAYVCCHHFALLFGSAVFCTFAPATPLLLAVRIKGDDEILTGCCPGYLTGDHEHSCVNSSNRTTECGICSRSYDDCDCAKTGRR